MGSVPESCNENIKFTIEQTNHSRKTRAERSLCTFVFSLFGVCLWLFLGLLEPIEVRESRRVCQLVLC